MDYIRPDYIKSLPVEAQKYFKEESFENRPYPVTIEQANEYFLQKVCKVNTKKEIKVVQVSKNKEECKRLVFPRDNYYDIFRYKYWEKLSFKTKVTALYWFYEDVCKELKIYRPTLKLFNETGSKNVCGAYYPHNHSFVLDLGYITKNDKNKEDLDDDYIEEDSVASAYMTLNTIAHELKHAQYFSTNKKGYFKNQNLKKYYSAPKEETVKFEKDFDKFEYTFNIMMYRFQPTEAEAYNYGVKKSREVFDLSNTKIDENGKKVALDDTSVVDLMVFRRESLDRKTYLNFFNNVMKDEFTNYLDLFNLLSDFSIEMMNYALEIDELDPLATNVGDEITLSEHASEEAKKYLEKYNESKNCFDEVYSEMNELKQKMFKKYKDFVVNEKISCYSENFKY